jgi:hypothetical protein
MNYLSKWLITNKSLKILNLSNNKTNDFTKEGAEIIFKSLINHTKILEINMSNMIITGIGEFLNKFLSNNISIKILKLRNNQLNLEDIRNLFDSLEINQTLMYLDIGENENFTGKNEMSKLICKMLKKNKFLRSLNIDNFGLFDFDIKNIFFDINNNNKILEKISITGNKVKLFTIIELGFNFSRELKIEVCFLIDKNNYKLSLVEEDGIKKLKENYVFNLEYIKL